MPEHMFESTVKVKIKVKVKLKIKVKNELKLIIPVMRTELELC